MESVRGNFSQFFVRAHLSILHKNKHPLLKKTLLLIESLTMTCLIIDWKKKVSVILTTVNFIVVF